MVVLGDMNELAVASPNPNSDETYANRHVGLAQRDRKWSSNEGQSANFRVVRVHVSTGYTPAKGNRRASRNGLVSDLFFIAARRARISHRKRWCYSATDS